MSQKSSQRVFLLFPTFDALQGWRRYGLVWFLGVFAAAALPPFYVLPLLIPAFSGLFLLTQNAISRRQAFADGWWWGLGYFTAGLYWICISLWVPPATFWWVTPFALFGLPAILGIYIGLVTLAVFWAGRKWRMEPVKKILLFASLFALAEYLRAQWFTGFPWNLIGYVWTASDVTLQLASVAGIYGLGWVAVVAGTVPSLWMRKEISAHAMRATVIAACMLAAIAAFGIWRLETHPTRYTTTRVRIVQADIAQNLKWDPRSVMEGLRKNIRLTQSAGLDAVQLVLWPETAVPYFIRSESRLTHDLGNILPPGALLVTGGMRNDFSRTDAWNSVFVIAGDGGIRAQYDKHHLVPFGEYIPFRAVLPMKTLVGDMGDFLSGAGAQTIAIDPYPAFSPLVCYEAIFPDAVTDGTHRAKWLFSLTDDAWFGISTGPLQDAQMARMRAVEQGLPLLRASNTGISAGFDAFGRILAWLPLEKEGVLDLYLPAAEPDQAIIGRYPQCGFLFIIVGTLLFVIACGKKSRVIL